MPRKITPITDYQLISKRVQRTVLALFIVFAAIGVVPLQTHAADTPTTEPEIAVEIRIPGVSFPCSHPANIGNDCVRSMGEYINGFYRYFAGAMGIIAAMLVMWGGIKWLTASGNASRVNDAKETIYSAIIALVLILGSYVILYTINPQLVKLDLPTLDSVVTIEQTNRRCSQNPVSYLQGGGCPSGQECCGQTMTLNLPGGETSECVWDICNNRNEVCLIAETPGQYGVLPSPPCLPAETICEDRVRGGDYRSWCPAIDSVLRQAKTKAIGATEFGQKFRYSGCGHRDNASIGDACVWNVTLDKFFEVYPTLPSELNAYQPRFIDCYTAGAEGVCWERSDGEVRPKDCNPQDVPCRNVTETPRPVAGAVSGCLVKIGATGSMDRDDYRCWNVPNPRPPTGGWVVPPSSPSF